MQGTCCLGSRRCALLDPCCKCCHFCHRGAILPPRPPSPHQEPDETLTKAKGPCCCCHDATAHPAAQSGGAALALLTQSMHGLMLRAHVTCLDGSTSCTGPHFHVPCCCSCRTSNTRLAAAWCASPRRIWWKMMLSPHLQSRGNGSRPRPKYLPASSAALCFVCCKKQSSPQAAMEGRLECMRFTMNPVPYVCPIRVCHSHKCCFTSVASLHLCDKRGG